MEQYFAEYIARLRACEELSESDRNTAADQLEKWESGEPVGVDYYKYEKWRNCGGIISAFKWFETPQGHVFWHRISEAGF